MTLTKDNVLVFVYRRRGFGIFSAIGSYSFSTQHLPNHFPELLPDVQINKVDPVTSEETLKPFSRTTNEQILQYHRLVWKGHASVCTWSFCYRILCVGQSEQRSKVPFFAAFSKEGSSLHVGGCGYQRIRFSVVGTNRPGHFVSPAGNSAVVPRSLIADIRHQPVAKCDRNYGILQQVRILFASQTHLRKIFVYVDFT